MSRAEKLWGQSGSRMGVTNGLTSLAMTAVNQTWSELCKYLRFTRYFHPCLQASNSLVCSILFSFIQNSYAPFIFSLYERSQRLLPTCSLYLTQTISLIHHICFLLLSITKLDDLNTPNTLYPIEDIPRPLFGLKHEI